MVACWGCRPVRRRYGVAARRELRGEAAAHGSDGDRHLNRGLLMVRLVDEALRHPARFGIVEGARFSDETIADPAVGTGTYLLGVLCRMAETTRANQGPGVVPGVIRAALKRVIGFELQFGPLPSLSCADGRGSRSASRQGNGAGKRALAALRHQHARHPYAEEEHIPQMLKPLAESRRQANAVSARSRSPSWSAIHPTRRRRSAAASGSRLAAPTSQPR